jgi:hypothetical protein
VAAIEGADLGVGVLGEERQADTGGSGGKEAGAGDGLHAADARLGVIEVADLVAPEDAEGDDVAEGSKVFEWAGGFAQQAGGEKALGGQDVDSRAGAVLAIGVLLGETEVGEGLKQAVDAGGFEVELAGEFADAQGRAGGGDSLEAGEAIDEALVGLSREHVAIIATPLGASMKGGHCLPQRPPDLLT